VTTEGSNLPTTPEMIEKWQYDAILKDLKEVNERAVRYGAIVTEIRRVAAKQAEDEGLWFVAKTAPEACLQEELRYLHHVIEGTS
jgi:hypothetical protein